MVPTIAVSHYPEGAGHATRMLGVARALEAEGCRVPLVGGGCADGDPALRHHPQRRLPLRGATRARRDRHPHSVPGRRRLAGTPCVVRPFTSEQRGVAGLLSDVPDFAISDGTPEVVDHVASPPASPTFDNGIDDIARAVRTDVR